VAYIKVIKEKFQKETNPERKKVLLNEYDTLVKEFDKPFDSNFVFKLSAKLENTKIDRQSIMLFLEQDTEKGVTYIPVDSMLPFPKVGI